MVGTRESPKRYGGCKNRHTIPTRRSSGWHHSLELSFPASNSQDRSFIDDRLHNHSQAFVSLIFRLTGPYLVLTHVKFD